MSTLALAAIRRVTKAVIGAVIRDEGDVSPAVVEAGHDLLLMSVNRATPVTANAEIGAAHIVAGAIEAAKADADDTELVIRSIVHGVIKGAWTIGSDVGSIAVKSIGVAVQVAMRIGIDADKATRLAVDGATDAGNILGADAAGWIVNALKNSSRRNMDWHEDPIEIIEMTALKLSPRIDRPEVVQFHAFASSNPRKRIARKALGMV